MDNILLFSTRDELTRIRLERVMYFEADANYTKVVFSNGLTATLLTSLVHLEKLIAGVLIEKTASLYASANAISSIALICSKSTSCVSDWC